MNSGREATAWEQVYGPVPFDQARARFDGIYQSQFMLKYLSTVLDLCPVGGRTLETGIGSGDGATWLSLRGVNAEGIDFSERIVQQASQVGNMLGGSARFRYGDLFELYSDCAQRRPEPSPSPTSPTKGEDNAAPPPPSILAVRSAGVGTRDRRPPVEGERRWAVVHSQGVFEHFTMAQIRAALAQQLALAEFVVFSVPSAYYVFSEMGDERLLTLEVWEMILAPFDVVRLDYYGDPQHGCREHVLCVLRGQEVTEELLAMMTAQDAPLPVGISAVVLAQNEAANMPECLECLQWCDEVIVIVMEGDPGDRTEEVSRPLATRILKHPRIYPHDSARVLGLTIAAFSHTLVIDADERVPPGLAAALRDIVTNHGGTFEGMMLPFRHMFAGHWMQNPGMYPGYTAPRLLKTGKAAFNRGLHSGVKVDGRITHFPADNPELAIVHKSFLSIHHYQEKQNRYTSDGESLSLFQSGAKFDWQRMLQHALEDLVSYYDRGRADIDGPYGLIYSLLSANYRLLTHAKLFERRANAGLLQPDELAVPQNTGEIATFLLQALTQQPKPQPAAIEVSDAADAADYVLTGPVHSRSGIGEDCRNIALAARAAGISISIQALDWEDGPSAASEADQAVLEELAQIPAKPGFTHIIQDFPSRWYRHPQAGRTIVRTMFETDRYPHDWVLASHNVDEIWVPTEIGRKALIDSGVDPAKIKVVPCCFDVTEFETPPLPTVTALSEKIKAASRFTFCSIFDWNPQKGWKTLLESFLRAFPTSESEEAQVQLVIKTWSTNGYSDRQILEQAAQHVMDAMGIDLLADGRIVFVFDKLPRQELIALCRACDCFALPSFGEGWGRPYTEAMLLGMPVVGTAGIRSSEFLNESNSYLIRSTMANIPEEAWRQVPGYKGHRWVQPDRDHLCEIMREVFTNPEAARARGAIAKDEMRARYSREVVGGIVAQVLRDAVS